MALTTGFVQQMKYNPVLHAAFVWLGPTSADTVLYYVQISDRDDEPGALIKSSLIDGLTAAMFTGRSVTLSTDDDNPSSIEGATIHPGPPPGPDGEDGEHENGEDGENDEDGENEDGENEGENDGENEDGDLDDDDTDVTPRA